MGKTNWRLVIVGVVMIVLAGAFFVGMGSMAMQSNDPVALMQTAGTVSGVVGVLGAVMTIVGCVGWRRRDPA